MKFFEILNEIFEIFEISKFSYTISKKIVYENFEIF
jgi:hypothetical protein